jgi:uncharacterized protein YqiB (DUF1249 family)
MKKNSIYTLVLVFLMLGCEKNESKTESLLANSTGGESKVYEKIALDTCIDAVESDSYAVLKSADEVIKEEENTEIIFYYRETENKLCVSSGKAHISRLL